MSSHIELRDNEFLKIRHNKFNIEFEFEIQGKEYFEYNDEMFLPIIWKEQDFRCIQIFETHRVTVVTIVDYLCHFAEYARKQYKLAKEKDNLLTT